MENLYKQMLKEEIAGNVTSFKNNRGDLIAFNYTPECQFKKNWNSINIQARGIVFDLKTKEIVAKPFDKIFNLSENMVDISEEEIEEISNKEDGSLIIVFKYKNHLEIMTRGSFNSVQADIAKRIIYSNVNMTDALITKGAGCTFLFELVGPSNLNVCRTIYKQDELILLNINIHQFAWELPKTSLENISYELGVKIKTYWSLKDTDLYSLAKEIKHKSNPNFEGIVIKFKSGKRVKIKSDLYCKLHKVLTGEFTTKRLLDLWAERKNGTELNSLLETVPDEFFSEINNELDKIDLEFAKHSQLNYTKYITMQMDKYNGLTRKDLALKYPQWTNMLSLIFNSDLTLEQKRLFDIDTFIKNKLRD